MALVLTIAPAPAKAATKPGKPFCAVNSMLYKNKPRTNAVKGADGYVYYRATKKDGPYYKLGETKHLYFNDYKAKQDVKYYYKLKAFRKIKGGKRVYSAASNIASGRRLLARPTLTRKIIKGEGIQASWTEVKGADGYQLWRSADKGYTYKKIYGGKKLTYLDKKVKKGQKYYYKVRAYRMVGDVKEYSYSSPSKHSRDRFVRQAKSWLGYSEGNGKYKTIVKIYNDYKPLARNIKGKYSEAWCTTFVSACGIKARQVDIMPRERICRYLIPYYQELKQWVEKDSYVPKKGDLIFYDWDDRGKGDCKGNPEHIGIVVKVKNKTMTVIEGNIYNKVGYHYVKLNSKHIRGFATPGFGTKNGITYK